MITILSPAKDLDTSPDKTAIDYTKPQFLEKSEVIAGVLKKKSAKQLSELMNISDKLGALNYSRYQEWSANSGGKSKSALSLFIGEVFRSLDAVTLTDADRQYAQDHLRILSGLYGMLRPNDEVMPYRLEMGTRLSVKRKGNLYKFWGDDPTEAINQQIDRTGSKYLVNLSSNEYFKVLEPDRITVPIITPVFKDLTPKGDYRVKFFYAKQQRGRMTRYLIEHRAMETDILRGYELDGYRFSEEGSTATKFVYLRDRISR